MKKGLFFFFLNFHGLHWNIDKLAIYKERRCPQNPSAETEVYGCTPTQVSVLISVSVLQNVLEAQRFKNVILKLNYFWTRWASHLNLPDFWVYQNYIFVEIGLFLIQVDQRTNAGKDLHRHGEDHLKSMFWLQDNISSWAQLRRWEASFGPPGCILTIWIQS